MNLTDDQIFRFKEKAQKEKYFNSFDNYNSKYFEISYIVPVSEFKSFSTPQWTHVGNIFYIDNTIDPPFYLIVVQVFYDNPMFYSYEIALTSNVVKFHQSISESNSFNIVDRKLKQNFFSKAIYKTNK